MSLIHYYYMLGSVTGCDCKNNETEAVLVLVWQLSKACDK